MFDVSQITEYLFVSAWPRARHADQIGQMGIRLILSMHWIKPSKHLSIPPLELMWLPTLDSPLFRMPISTLRRGANTALKVIEEGGKVLAHCSAGRHRGVAMACSILVASGYSSNEAMDLIKQKRSSADPDIWYIRSQILGFEKDWRSRIDRANPS